MAPLFPSLYEEAVFWAFFSMFLVLIAWIGRAQRALRSKESVKKRESDAASSALFTLSIIVVTLVLGYARIGVLPSWFFYPGLALFLVGAVFYLWAKSVLGRFWSIEVRVLTDHTVIEKGPFRLIRHPMYLGQVLVYIGLLGLALQSWAAILFILIVSSIYYGNRIRIEEKFLVAELGNAYLDYMKRTKRLIPFVW
jgi:protein-S-isoprenylcysteine O-methyltransferase Ste14